MRCIQKICQLHNRPFYYGFSILLEYSLCHAMFNLSANLRCCVEEASGDWQAYINEDPQLHKFERRLETRGRQRVNKQVYTSCCCCGGIENKDVPVNSSSPAVWVWFQTSSFQMDYIGITDMSISNAIAHKWMAQDPILMICQHWFR